MKQALVHLQVQTRGRGFHEVTRDLTSQLSRTGLKQGIMTLHLQHTSASLVIQENADPDVRVDFDAFFERLVPDGDDLFIHTCEGPDDMSAHIRTALTTVNLSIPFDQGRLCLGTWQGVYVWEHRTSPHSRTLTIHFLGE